MLRNKDKAIFASLNEIASAMRPISGKRVAAAITYKNITIIATNSYRSDPFAAKFATNCDAIYLHAETQVLKHAIKILTPKELRRSTLCVLRLKHPSGTNHKLCSGIARPCEGCQRAINEYKIGRVLFTTDHGTIEELYL